jgi:hypothetical protein
MIFNPLHHLALLEHKTNALDQAAPLQGWQLPEEFAELRRQMEARLGKRGRREYVQVLRLLSQPVCGRRCAGEPLPSMPSNIWCCARSSGGPPKLDLENYPHLPLAEVA